MVTNLPEIKPVPDAKVHHVRLDLTHKLVEIDKGVKFEGWTFGDTVPGPTVHVRQGDRVIFTMTNRSDEAASIALPMPHSIDFHSAMVNPIDKYRSIPPKQSLTFEWTANYPADLKQLDFFSSLEEAELLLLSRRAVLRRLAPGEALFHEGEPLDPALRFVYAGTLQIRRTATNGKETILRLIRRGEMFGVAALFDRKLAPGSAIATEPSEVLEIRLEDLLSHLTREPVIAMKLLVTFAQRLRELQDTLHAVMSGRARTRLARAILNTLDQGGATSVGQGFLLKTKLPHATLSRMVGITYEECVRLIREWSHAPEVLRYERGGVITVCDRRELERQASED